MCSIYEDQIAQVWNVDQVIKSLIDGPKTDLFSVVIDHFKNILIVFYPERITGSTVCY